MDKLERWQLPNCEAMFLDRAEAEGWRQNWAPEEKGAPYRVYIIDADEMDGQKCENCECRREYPRTKGQYYCAQYVDIDGNDPPKDFCCSYYEKREYSGYAQ